MQDHIFGSHRAVSMRQPSRGSSCRLQLFQVQASPQKYVEPMPCVSGLRRVSICRKCRNIMVTPAPLISCIKFPTFAFRYVLLIQSPVPIGDELVPMSCGMLFMPSASNQTARGFLLNHLLLITRRSRKMQKTVSVQINTAPLFWHSHRGIC